MIIRAIQNHILQRLHSGKAIVVIGPRQVGKTTLVRQLLGRQEHLFLDGDDPTVRAILRNANTETIRQLIGTHESVFVDEAQRIDNIGLTLKIIVDQFPYVQLYVSGSSAFEVKQMTSESLTGRKWEYLLLPISWNEYTSHIGLLKSQQQLELRMVYGMYPDVINHPGDERGIIKGIADSYLHKDLFAFESLRKPELLERLLQALAYQVGQEVSYNELSRTLGVDKNTIIKYIDVLQRGYVIFPLAGFKRNLRNEIKANRKIYFYDNGIRNAVIGNFNDLNNRSDVGALWENFLMSERIKTLTNTQSEGKPYFWRTTSKQEIDYIEEHQGDIMAYEFKWNPSAKAKHPKSFLDTYNASIDIIHRDNFQDFLNS